MEVRRGRRGPDAGRWYHR